MIFDISSKISIHSTFPTVQLDNFMILTHFTNYTITGTSNWSTLYCTLSQWYAIDEREGVARVLLHGRHAGGDLLPRGRRSRGGASFHQSIGARPLVGHSGAEPRLGVGHLPPGLPAAAHPAASGRGRRPRRRWRRRAGGGVQVRLQLGELGGRLPRQARRGGDRARAVAQRRGLATRPPAAASLCWIRVSAAAAVPEDVLDAGGQGEEARRRDVSGDVRETGGAFVDLGCVWEEGVVAERRVQRGGAACAEEGRRRRRWTLGRCARCG